MLSRKEKKGGKQVTAKDPPVWRTERDRTGIVAVKRLNRGFWTRATVHLVYPRVPLITLRLPSVSVAAEAQLIIQRSRLLEWDRMYYTKWSSISLPDLNVALAVYVSIMMRKMASFVCTDCSKVRWPRFEIYPIKNNYFWINVNLVKSTRFSLVNQIALDNWNIEVESIIGIMEFQ